MKNTGSLDVVELVRRSEMISQTLNQGLSRLDGQQDHCGLHSFRYNRSTTTTSSVAATKIWVHAARIYLTIIVSGWQPSNPDIRQGVSEALKLLQIVTSVSHLRSLAWPLCVAGCMAEAGEQEQNFRELFADMGDMRAMGPLSETQNIVEKIWQNRDSVDRETWDLAFCFRILGTPVLLV